MKVIGSCTIFFLRTALRNGPLEVDLAEKKIQKSVGKVRKKN